MLRLILLECIVQLMYLIALTVNYLTTVCEDRYVKVTMNVKTDTFRANGATYASDSSHTS